jgi:hypothetical protein
MKMFLMVLLAVTTLCSCKDQNKTAVVETTAEKKSYFPVIDFLKGQISYVDSLPSAILKIVIKNKRSDSSYIRRDEFNEIAKDFIPPELEQKSFEKNYKENSFLDQTTQSATFNYAATDIKSPLQRVDVLATADEMYSKVKSVFIQEDISKNDTTIVKKLFWQTNKRLQVITIMRVPGQQDAINQMQVIWDAGE